MTGSEFKAIREFNGISQIKVANFLGYSTRTPIINAEKEDFLPIKFDNVLIELLGKDFSNKEFLSDYISKIPKRFFEKKKRFSLSNFFRI